MSLGAVRKDLRLMIDAADRAGATLPVTSATLQTYDDAADDG
jgi:3-hydroxyisobutyrate dehydrogenase-like beta-hydroxyacid dehydrogenase